MPATLPSSTSSSSLSSLSSVSMWSCSSSSSAFSCASSGSSASGGSRKASAYPRVWYSSTLGRLLDAVLVAAMGVVRMAADAAAAAAASELSSFSLRERRDGATVALATAAGGPWAEAVSASAGPFPFCGGPFFSAAVVSLALATCLCTYSRRS